MGAKQDKLGCAPPLRRTSAGIAEHQSYRAAPATAADGLF